MEHIDKIAIITCFKKNSFSYFLLLNVHIKMSLKRNVKQRFKQARHPSLSYKRGVYKTLQPYLFTNYRTLRDTALLKTRIRAG